MFGVVWDYYSVKLQSKQYKQNTSPKSYKFAIKILANPGLAYSGFEQPVPGAKVLAHIRQVLLLIKTSTSFLYTSKKQASSNIMGQLLEREFFSQQTLFTGALSKRMKQLVPVECYNNTGFLVFLTCFVLFLLFYRAWQKFLTMSLKVSTWILPLLLSSVPEIQITILQATVDCTTSMELGEGLYSPALLGQVEGLKKW